MRKKYTMINKDENISLPAIKSSDASDVSRNSEIGSEDVFMMARKDN